MIVKNLITTKGRTHQILSNDPAVEAWFNQPDQMVDTMLHQINSDRLYDPVLANKEGLVILDIGANIGLFSLYAADSANRIVAIEPTPGTVDILTKLTAGNDKIKVLPVAVAGENGTVSFMLHNNSSTNNSIVAGHEELGIERVTVPSKTLKTVLDEEGIEFVDFVKCDVEGAETLIITEQTVSEVQTRIGSFFIEVHQTNIGEEAWPGNLEQNRQNLLSILRAGGYSAEPIIHDQIFAWK